MTGALVTEVGPRDGLQNESVEISVEDRVRLIEMLAETGIRRIECGAFVSPVSVPQMANSDEVIRRVRRRPGVCYSALVPNLKGLERALDAGVDEIAVFGAASETFCRNNINCTLQESLDRFAETVSAAIRAAVPVRGYVSCALGCPYEGAVPPGAVFRVAVALRDMGCEEIALGDTIGSGAPEGVRKVFGPIADRIGAERVSGHFHDTGGRALDNILEALKLGVRSFDGSVGGLGGCPYAPGAPGNVATEAVVGFLESNGCPTGVDPKRLNAVKEFIRNRIPLESG